MVAMGTKNTQEGRPALSCFVMFTLKGKMQNNVE